MAFWGWFDNPTPSGSDVDPVWTSLQEGTCPACGSKGPHIYRRGGDALNLECVTCGGVYWYTSVPAFGWKPISPGSPERGWKDIECSHQRQGEREQWESSMRDP